MARADEREQETRVVCAKERREVGAERSRADGWVVVGTVARAHAGGGGGTDRFRDVLRAVNLLLIARLLPSSNAASRAALVLFSRDVRSLGLSFVYAVPLRPPSTRAVMCAA